MDDQLRTLIDLVRIPSVDGTDAEVAIVETVAGLLRVEGIEVDCWPIPVADLAGRADFPGMEVPRSAALGLVARLPGSGGGRSLMVNGHLDVVPPGDLDAWTDDPFSGRLLDGHVYGRGACDMKGGVVSALHALLALRGSALSGHPLRGDVLFAAVVGEEDGGLGTYAMLDRGWRADACVITEPTNLDLLVANGGALTFRLRVPGRASHASTRTAGVSAVEKFQPVFAALRAFEATRNATVDPVMARWDVAYPLEIGTVRAGDWSSSVPDLLVAEGRFGVALDEPVAVARAAFEAAVADACRADPWLRDHPVTVEWWGGQFASGRCSSDELVAALVRADGRSPSVASLGDKSAISVGGAPYGSDLRLLAAAGVPTLQYGPGEARYAHAPDERVPVAQVHHCTETLVRLARDWCA
ncbi:ArgE/DapE family deacylase [Virgisporangium ochraceum]|uniref:Probable succinyl-diaminopimelate desuccinylase n=1 Tax=Virgisporangium ochraceum TaxID=65505 RepID=A0A8J4A8N0_9ACTN|nr:ArgE/DapE family deacylase [Virgisporangium ochraceum]GIJ74976.1 acetylornithine deacetylase [Virgisporangium ochraceum]